MYSINMKELPSEKNARELQEKVDNSPFDHVSFFVDPSHDTSVENCTAQANEMMDELIAFANGEIEPEYRYTGSYKHDPEKK
jgi:hypothetical protein